MIVHLLQKSGYETSIIAGRDIKAHMDFGIAIEKERKRRAVRRVFFHLQKKQHLYLRTACGMPAMPRRGKIVIGKTGNLSGTRTIAAQRAAQDDGAHHRSKRNRQQDTETSRNGLQDFRNEHFAIHHFKE